MFGDEIWGEEGLFTSVLSLLLTKSVTTFSKGIHHAAESRH